MSLTLFSFAMLLICILCIGKGVFKGFKGGLFLSLISLSTVISSIIFAILISRPISRSIAAEIVSIIRYESSGEIGIFNTASAIERAAMFLIQAIISSVIFAALFLIAKLFIGWILRVILNDKAKGEGRITDARTKKDRLAGAIIGGICGMLIAMSVTAPIMGTLHLVSDAVGVLDVLDEDMLSDANFDRSSLDAIEKYASDVPGNFCYSLGGEMIYSQIAVGEFNGKTVSAVTEIKNLARGIECVLRIVGRFSAGEVDLSQKLDAGELYAVMDKSEIIKSVVAEGISEFSSAWLSGNGFMGIYRPDFNDDIEPLVDGLLAVCVGTNEYNVKNTVGTLVDIFGVLVECGISADSKSEEIDYYLLVTKLYEVIEKNPDMDPVKDALLKLATNAFADALLGNVSESELDNICKLIADKTMIAYGVEGDDINAKKSELKSGLSEFLGVYGISEDDKVIDLFAERLIAEAERNGGWISASIVEELITVTKPAN